jgi:hypothetical protein
MEFVFWPEVFDSVYEIRQFMSEREFYLEDVTHFYELSEQKTLHFPNLVLKFKSTHNQFVLYQIEKSGTYKPISSFEEGDF